MTDISRYELLVRFQRTVVYGNTDGAVAMYTSFGDYLGFVVLDRHTNKRMLPTTPGGHFTLHGDNVTPWMAGFPVRLGTEDDLWLNLFPDNLVTDPDHMPTTAMRYAQPHSTIEINGLRLPGGRREPFLVTEDGVVFQDITYDRIEVGYRPPEEPGSVTGLPGGPLPMGGGGTAGVDVRYRQQAYTFGILDLVPRATVAAALASSGLCTLDPNNDLHWSAAHLRREGVPHRDIELDPIVIE